MLWKLLAEAIPGGVSSTPPATNIVMLDVNSGNLPVNAPGFAELLASKGVLVRARDKRTVRFVTHRHIGIQDVQSAAMQAASIAGI
jgi:threonine aldolase